MCCAVRIADGAKSTMRRSRTDSNSRKTSSPIFESRSRTARSEPRKTAWSFMPTAAAGGRCPLSRGPASTRKSRCS